MLVCHLCHLNYSGTRANSHVTTLIWQLIQRNSNMPKQEKQKTVNPERKIDSETAKLKEDANTIINSIEKKTLDTLQQFIAQNNWDAVASFVKTSPQLPLSTILSPSNSNLNVRTFLAQVLTYTFKQLTDELLFTQQQKTVKVIELDKEKMIVQDEIKSLEQKLNKAKSRLLELDKSSTEVTTTMKQVSSEVIAAQQRLAEVKKVYQDNYPRLQQWRQRLQVDIKQWTADDVAFLLKEVDIGQQAESFKQSKIDGEVLVELSTTDLMHLKLTFIEAKRLLKAIYLIKNYKDIYTIPPGLLQWSNETVCMWLENNKFAHLVPVFKQFGITGGELVFMDRQDLKVYLKIDVIVDCIRLEKAIKEVVQNEIMEQNQVKKQLSLLDEEFIAVQQVSNKHYYHILIYY